MEYRSTKGRVYDNIVEIRKLIAPESDYRYDMAFSDIVSALSDGEINEYLAVAHDVEYWRVPGMKSMEIFANLCSIEINGYISKAVLKRLFPELIEAFERML